MALALAVWLVPRGAESRAPAEQPPHAQPAELEPGAEAVEDRALRVVVAGSRPFVQPGSDAPKGLSVDVFQEAALAIGARFELSRESSVEAALRAVRDGRADIAVGPLSITAARARYVQFTQPYYQSSLAILAPAGDSLFSKLEPFLTVAFLAGTAGLVFVLALVGFFIWLAERKQNPTQFPDSPVRGIGIGVWLALVTMTTVGYGDRVPRTVAGRLVAAVWMLLSMIVASSLTAFMATALTLSQLDGPRVSQASHLRDRFVAVVAGTTGESFAKEHHARIRALPNLEEAINTVQAQEAAALVFDRPMLRYWLSEHPDSDLQISEANYQPQGYGFALQSSAAKFRNDLDVALLSLAAEGRVEALAEHWLGGH